MAESQQQVETIAGYHRVPTVSFGWASSLMDLGFRWDYEVPFVSGTVYRTS